jgi:aminopeptidase N
MENWGMVTYREIALLTDPDNRSISNEQYVSLVIAHELAHQWFGNLVTMKWWDDLWLNESFASLMEHLCLNELHPDWHQWEIFTGSDVLAATNRDIYKDIQPVGVKVTDPDLIETLFDPGIVYAKGARLLKMLREYIGDEAFNKGLQNYFKKHAYGNTTRDDLWEVLSRSSGKNIHELMTPWLVQPGMPLLTANQADESLQISQKRYVLDTDNVNTLWPVPLLANQQLEANLITKQASVMKAPKDYVVLNQKASGHFFTKYENPAHRTYLAEQFKLQSVSSETRMNLLNDAIMLARKGESSLVDALELATSSPQEPRDSVWSLIARAIGYAQQLTEGDDETENNIKQAKVKLAKAWHAKFGWDSKAGEDPNTQQLRHTALALMLSGEDKATITEGLKRYKNSKIEELDAEIRSSILICAVKNGSATVIDDLIDAYKKSSADIQLDICSALTSTKDEKVAKRIIAEAFGNNGFVRPQDLMRWIAFLLRNRYTRQLMWQFIVDKWEWLEETLGQSKSFDYLPTYTAASMNSKEWENKYHQLFEPKLSNKLLKQNITIGFSDIAARIAWRERDEQTIKDFFKAL